MKTPVFLLVLICSSIVSGEVRPRPCMGLEYTKIESLSDYEGVWYLVAHKHHVDFGKKSSTLKLELDGDDKLKMTEYHVNKNGECHGPIEGMWTKTTDGTINIEVTEKGEKHEMKNVMLLSKYIDPHHDEDAAILLYGCATGSTNMDCPDDKLTLAILSKQRRPATRVVYHLAEFVKKVCLDPLNFRRLQTSRSCGNDIVSSQEKASSEEESGETKDKPEPEPKPKTDPPVCVVQDIPGIPLTEFPLEPLKLYLVATNAPWFRQKGVRSMVWDFKGQTDGAGDEMKLTSEYQVIIHGVCFNGSATEWADPDDPTGATYIIKIQFKDQDGKIVTWQEKEKVIYMRHGLIATFRCEKEHPEGGCLKPIFHVWSKTEHVRHGALLHMYDKAKEHCTDPTEFVFLNTHAECYNPVNLMEQPHHEHVQNEENTCKVADLHLAEGFSLKKLKGTWFLATVTMSKRLQVLIPNFHKGSFTMKLTDGDNDNELKGQYYEDMPLESTGTCKNGEGKVTMVEGKETTIRVTANIEFGGEQRNFELEGKVLHVGPELLLLYNCYNEDADGKCKADKAEAALFSKSRYLRHHDRLSLYPHFSKTCIPYNKAYFLNLQSHCGMPLEESFHTRHGYMALKHGDILDIMETSAQYKCLPDQLTGQHVCLKKFSKAGPWYVHATNDADMYGFIGKYKFEGCSGAGGRGIATIMVNGEKECIDLSLYISQHKKPAANNKTDYYYRVTFSSNTVDHIHTGRFIWNNYKLALFYSCDWRNEAGDCLKPKIFLLGRHETLDHHEWMVIEHLFDALCIDKKTIRHLSAHENCLHDMVLEGRKTYKVAENCDWDNFVGKHVNLDDDVGVFHFAAFAEKTKQPDSHTGRATKDGDQLKLESYQMIKGSCVKTDGIVTDSGKEHNGFELKYKSPNSGKEKILRYWVGGEFGPYRAVIGCTGANCNRDTGFAIISSKYRISDPIAIHQTYQWFADHCIDPDWFELLDTHSTCGAELDTRSCKVADIQSVGIDNEKVNGKWYITGSNKKIYKSAVCELTDDTGTKAARCFATYPDKTGCWTSEFHGTATPEGQVTCDGQPADYPTCAPGGGAQGKILYQSADHMLVYWCMKENKDGTCVSHETFVVLLAKTSTVTKDVLPGDLIEKLQQACIPLSTLRYLEENKCDS